MKVYVTIYLCTALIWALTVKQVEHIELRTTECVNETKVDPELVEKAWGGGEFPDDKKLKEFFFCYAKQAGFMDEAGAYQPEVIKRRLKPELDEELLDRIITDCTRKTWGSGPETAFHLARCYHRRAPKTERDDGNSTHI